MDIILMKEEPLFRKCCFFLPLRLCLQTWACIKMVADVLSMSYLLLVIAILYSYEHGGFFRVLSIYHLLALVVVVLVVDVGFLIALITGIFTKSVAVLRVFYFYEFYAMVVDTSIVVIICLHIIEINTAQGIITAIIGLLLIILDLCIILTVKSEMVKLRNKEQYDFSRMKSNDDEVTGKFTTEVECFAN